MQMAGMSYGGNMGETETAIPVEPSTESARRRRMEIHQFRFVAADASVAPPLENGRKRKPLEMAAPAPRQCKKAAKDNYQANKNELSRGKYYSETYEEMNCSCVAPASSVTSELEALPEKPKFGMTSVCGRRRDMEDAVAIHPSLNHQNTNGLHFYGVYDGHGCSHVATRCKSRMHEIVRDEVESGEASFEEIMARSFSRMDQEVINWSSGVSSSNCRCELQTPQCDAVGSTAVVALVTKDKIVVSNCGDSRAVLCRNGVAVPLSSDHKPDRPDELARIEKAAGRVIYWDAPRVLGVLAMSRAIGDNYLKPYVICEPEVTVTERSEGDECLILASDGLWDVVTNETACNVARICLQSRKSRSPPRTPENNVTATVAGVSSDQACSDASVLLAKLALARNSTDNVSVVVVDLRRNL